MSTQQTDRGPCASRSASATSPPPPGSPAATVVVGSRPTAAAATAAAARPRPESQASGPSRTPPWTGTSSPTPRSWPARAWQRRRGRRWQRRVPRGPDRGHPPAGRDGGRGHLQLRGQPVDRQAGGVRRDLPGAQAGWPDRHHRCGGRGPALSRGHSLLAPDERLTPWMIHDLPRIAWIVGYRAAELTDEER
jgi:hypothetical protein